MTDGVSQPVQPARSYKGITHVKSSPPHATRWRAQISYQSRTWALGDYESEQEAARVYDRAAIVKSGFENASLNFPREDYKQLAPELERMTMDEMMAQLRRERQQARAARLAANSAGRQSASNGNGSNLYPLDTMMVDAETSQRDGTPADPLAPDTRLDPQELGAVTLLAATCANQAGQPNSRQRPPSRSASPAPEPKRQRADSHNSEGITAVIDMATQPDDPADVLQPDPSHAHGTGLSGLSALVAAVEQPPSDAAVSAEAAQVLTLLAGRDPRVEAVLAHVPAAPLAHLPELGLPLEGLSQQLADAGAFDGVLAAYKQAVRRASEEVSTTSSSTPGTAAPRQPARQLQLVTTQMTELLNAAEAEYQGRQDEQPGAASQGMAHLGLAAQHFATERGIHALPAHVAAKIKTEKDEDLSKGELKLVLPAGHAVPVTVAPATAARSVGPVRAAGASRPLLAALPPQASLAGQVASAAAAGLPPAALAAKAAAHIKSLVAGSQAASRRDGSMQGNGVSESGLSFKGARRRRTPRQRSTGCHDTLTPLVKYMSGEPVDESMARLLLVLLSLPQAANQSLPTDAQVAAFMAHSREPIMAGPAYRNSTTGAESPPTNALANQVTRLLRATEAPSLVPMQLDHTQPPPQQQVPQQQQQPQLQSARVTAPAAVAISSGSLPSPPMQARVSGLGGPTMPGATQPQQPQQAQTAVVVAAGAPIGTAQAAGGAAGAMVLHALRLPTGQIIHVQAPAGQPPPQVTVANMADGRMLLQVGQAPMAPAGGQTQPASVQPRPAGPAMQPSQPQRQQQPPQAMQQQQGPPQQQQQQVHVGMAAGSKPQPARSAEGAHAVPAVKTQQQPTQQQQQQQGQQTAMQQLQGRPGTQPMAMLQPSGPHGALQPGGVMMIKLPGGQVVPVTCAPGPPQGTQTQQAASGAAKPGPAQQPGPQLQRPPAPPQQQQQQQAAPAPNQQQPEQMKPAQSQAPRLPSVTYEIVPGSKMTPQQVENTIKMHLQAGKIPDGAMVKVQLDGSMWVIPRGTQPPPPPAANRQQQPAQAQQQSMQVAQAQQQVRQTQQGQQQQQLHLQQMPQHSQQQQQHGQTSQLQAQTMQQQQQAARQQQQRPVNTSATNVGMQQQHTQQGQGQPHGSAAPATSQQQHQQGPRFFKVVNGMFVADAPTPQPSGPAGVKQQQAPPQQQAQAQQQQQQMVQAQQQQQMAQAARQQAPKMAYFGPNGQPMTMMMQGGPMPHNAVLMAPGARSSSGSGLPMMAMQGQIPPGAMLVPSGGQMLMPPGNAPQGAMLMQMPGGGPPQMVYMRPPQQQQQQQQQPTAQK